MCQCEEAVNQPAACGNSHYYNYNINCFRIYSFLCVEAAVQPAGNEEQLLHCLSGALTALNQFYFPRHFLLLYFRCCEASRPLVSVIIETLKTRRLYMMENISYKSQSLHEPVALHSF